MCYRLVEEVSDLPGNFDSCIDCTYVLIMEGSTREKQIRDETLKASITSRIIYQYNKGYKNCNKKLRVYKTNYDLEHALKNVFKHAMRNGFKRILVLEDDCEFDDRIRQQKIIDDICEFLITKNPQIYTLGSFMPIVNPFTFLDHQRLLYNAGSHAIIYNHEYMSWLLNHDCMLGHVDFETNRHWSKFTYKIPLAYQKITHTQNVEDAWKIPYILFNNLIFKPSGINKEVQPGYDLIKKWSEILMMFLCVWILSHIS